MRNLWARAGTNRKGAIMAIGDAAAAAGYDLVAGTDDLRNGFSEINKSRDYTAALGTELRAVDAGKAPIVHTHVSAHITDASSTSGANRLALFDSSGYLHVSDPIMANNPVTKSYCDANSGGSTQANGPTSTAYNRNSTGSGWYAVWMNSALQFMRNTSSRRYKQHIHPLDGTLARVLALVPVTYELLDESAPGPRIGLIAEDVAEVYPEVVTFDDEGRPDAIDYGALVAPLIGAVNELAAAVNYLAGRVADLERDAGP